MRRGSPRRLGPITTSIRVGLAVGNKSKVVEKEKENNRDEAYHLEEWVGERMKKRKTISITKGNFGMHTGITSCAEFVWFWKRL